MKKVLVVMAMAMSVGCMSAIAAETSINSAICCQSTQDEYTKIEVSAIPDVVKKAVEEAYPGQTIKEASEAEKDGAKTYKLVLVSAEETESTVIFNEKGEEIK